MKILFFHPNMPGQYKHMARVLAADKNNQVVFLTKPKMDVEIPGVIKVEYEVKRDVSKDTHRYLIPVERGIFASQEIWRVCKQMKSSGFTPDVICGHFGWGDGFFIKDIFPNTPLLSFLEFFYDAYGADVGFLEEMDNESISPDHAAKLRIKNMIHISNMTWSDWGVTPTFFQHNRHPDIFHPRISVLHDGIDTDVVKPATDNISLTLPGGVTLTSKDEVVTYISRNFEPYRGFPQFMRAAEIIQKRRPNCHILMVGADGVSYGKAPKKGEPTFRQQMLKEVTLDKSRFHTLGYLPYDQMLKVMQISGAHIYLTVPFVLSWSMMEAMSSGCVVIGSNTEPVREVIRDNENGLLVDFFSPQHLAERIDEVFAHKDRMQHIRKAARQTVLDGYALNKVLPLHLGLVQDLAAGKKTPPTAALIEKFNIEHGIRSQKEDSHEEVRKTRRRN